MHTVSENLFLVKISLNDYNLLFELMGKIYPPAYGHLWLDKGKWYLNKLYSKVNLESELNNSNSRYYFVKFENEIIGILKILLNENFNGKVKKNSIKLQRIYLDSTVQGKGLGKKIINWLESKFSFKKGTTLWLEVMDSQERAISFYKKLGFKIVDQFRFQSDLMIEDLKGMYKMSKEL